MSIVMNSTDQNQAASTGSETQSQEEKDILVVARGGGIAFIGSVATRSLSYAYSWALVKIIGADYFGQFTLALAIVLFIGTVSNIGLTQGVIRYGTIHEQAGKKANVYQVTLAALRIALPISLVFMLLAIWAAPFIAEKIFHKDQLAVFISIAVISIPFMTLQNLLLAGTRSLKMMKFSTIVWIIQPLLAILIMVFLSFRGLGFLTAAYAYVISYICGAALAVYTFLRLIPSSERSGERYAPAQMLKFSLPLSLTEWMHFANERTEIFFLGLIPNAVNISIYKIAWSLAGLETMLRLSLEHILAPFSSDLAHRGTIHQLEGLYKATAKWGFTAALMILIIYCLFGKEIMGFFDPSLVIGTGVLVALGLAQLFNEFTGPCNTILLMSGRSTLALINTIVLFVTSVGLDWYLIPKYGLTGAAIAGAATVILVNILRVVEVWMTMKIHPFKASMIKPVAAGLISAAAVYYLRSVFIQNALWMTVIYILVFCALYLALFLLFKLDPEDQIVLDTFKSKIPVARIKHETN